MFTGNLLKIRGTLTIVLYDEFIKKSCGIKSSDK